MICLRCLKPQFTIRRSLATLVDHNTLQSDRYALQGLTQAIRIGAQERIVQELQSLTDKGQEGLVNQVQLLAALRALRPFDFHTNGHTHSTKHRLYRQRLTYLREWATSSKIKKDKDVYFVLLEEARLESSWSVDTDISRSIWREMLESGIEPDARCYNSYMASICIQPSNLARIRLRRTSESSKDKALRKRLLAHTENVVEEAMTLYRQMIMKHLKPTAMTIELLLLALAASRNIAGMRSLILQTWNIGLAAPSFDALDNQETLDEYDEEGIDLADNMTGANVAKLDLEELYPTQNTLRIVAMSFGVAQQNELGLQAVQLLSQVYHMPISAPVWASLMSWASHDMNCIKGYTKDTAVDSLLALSKRYQCNTSVGMYAAAIKAALIRKNYTKTASLLEQMLQSVIGHERPVMQSTKRVPHARKVAETAIKRLQGRYLQKLRSLEVRLATAQANGAPEAIKHFEAEVNRRRNYVRDLQSYWTERLEKFDAESIACVQAYTKRHHGTESDSSIVLEPHT